MLMVVFWRSASTRFEDTKGREKEKKEREREREIASKTQGRLSLKTSM